jgi:hypothetical protein
MKEEEKEFKEVMRWVVVGHTKSISSLGDCTLSCGSIELCNGSV